jgi:hypothetical protein
MTGAFLHLKFRMFGIIGALAGAPARWSASPQGALSPKLGRVESFFTDYNLKPQSKDWGFLAFVIFKNWHLISSSPEMYSSRRF